MMALYSRGNREDLPTVLPFDHPREGVSGHVEEDYSEPGVCGCLPNLGDNTGCTGAILYSAASSSTAGGNQWPAGQPGRFRRLVGAPQRHRKPALRPAAADQHGIPARAHAPGMRADHRSAAGRSMPGELPAVRARHERLLAAAAAAAPSLGIPLLSLKQKSQTGGRLRAASFFTDQASTK